MINTIPVYKHRNWKSALGFRNQSCLCFGSVVGADLVVQHLRLIFEKERNKEMSQMSQLDILIVMGFFFLVHAHNNSNRMRCS